MTVKAEDEKAGIPQVGPKEAKRLVDEEGYVHVDVRSQREYDAGHPAGSLNVPIMFAAARGMERNPDFIAVMQGLFAKDAKLVLGCRSGQRSQRAAEMLATVGYAGCVNQLAGFDGVRDAFGRISVAGWAESDLATEHTTEGGDYEALKARALG